MAVHVDIIAELERRSVDKAATELDKRFHSLSVPVSADVKAAQIHAEAEKIRKEFSNIRAEIKVDVDRGTITRVGQLERALSRAGSALTSFSGGAADAHKNLMTLGTTAMKTVRGLGALGAVPATMMVLDLAKVTAQASQSIALLPAVATAAGAGIGTLALATHGLSDAIKDVGDPEKFAADLQLISPAAQQVALSIRQLMPQLRQFQRATQDAFLADFGGQGGIIEQLTAAYLPSIQNMTTGIAGAFNTMMKGISADLMTPETQGQIQNIMTNITVGFQNALPAVRSFVQAFIDLTDVGSEFLPGLGTSIAGAAEKFAEFIRNAKDSGQLKIWIQEGIDAVKSLVGGIEELLAAGHDLYEFFTSGSGVDDFKDDMQGLHQITSLLSGDFHVFTDDLISEFDQLTGASRTFVNIWLDIPEALATAANKIIDVVNGLIQNINNAMKDSILAKILNFIPGGPSGADLNIPNIPHVPSGGDWRDLAGPPIVTGPVAPNQPNRTSRPLGSPGLPGPNGQYGVPLPPPTGPGGGKPSDRERRDAIIAGLDPSLYHVDPYAAIPGMPTMATTGGPTGPGMYGPGGGAGGTVDPVAVQEARFNVESKAHDLEESIKDRLALQRDNQATAEQVNDAQWKEHQNQIDLWKAQQELVDKQRGTTKQITQGMDQLGAALDPDFGISKGLGGLAENLVKFLGNMAFAPMMAQLNAIQKSSPSQGGYGLMGILGASGAFGDKYTGLNSTTGGATGTSMYSGSATASMLGPAGLMAGSTNPNLNAMLAMAQSASGKTKYAGASDLVNGLADCSGSISDLYEILKTGMSTPARDFTTTNFASDAEAAKLGFLPGFQQGAFNVGVNPYPGNSGHMAATLPNGINFEGGGGTGGGAQYGGSASGALDPQFEKHYYLPVGGTATNGVSPGNPAYQSSGGSTMAPSGVSAPALYSPENRNPGLTSPLPPLTGSTGYGGGTGMPFGLSPAPSVGGPMAGSGAGLGLGPQPGVGSAAGSRIGGLAPVAPNPGGGGVGIMSGGSIDTAIGLAASAFPGVGQAAATGMKLASRAIEYAGQVAGIGASGLMETFLPTGGSELANNNWLTRIAGGLAGASAALPNIAGGIAGKAQMSGQAPVTPGDVASGQGTGPPPGPGNNIAVTYNNNGATEDRAGKDLAANLSNMHMGSMASSSTIGPR